ncbi:hypothetical protein EG831_07945 [bacterium]|nr:hypothetical protein [bacterium]
MNWLLVPALVGAGLMVLFGLGAAFRPEALAEVGVSYLSPLGRSEIRAVFGGMFVALGGACLVLREPIVFAVVGAAWLGDVAVRLGSVVADGVPPKQAIAVLGVGTAIGLALVSGYWTA